MPGGGSKPGERRGGRQKGTGNKAVAARQAALEDAERRATEGMSPDEIKLLSPLDVMLLAMRTAVQEGKLSSALVAAKEAAPYIHAKLTSTTIDATVRRTAADFTDEELLALERAGMGSTGEDEARASTH